MTGRHARIPTGDTVERLRLHLSGIVQGVGFRPFVYRLAQAERLGGFVHNTGEGVVIEVEGQEAALRRFLARLDAERPPHAWIRRQTIEKTVPQRDTGFHVRPSAMTTALGVAITPDLATCPDCRREIVTPSDRRYRYPFTSCVNCGPRYSIIEAPPYDRARTTMRHFPMCGACVAEYGDPADRRFHAEPIACAACGPRLAFWSRDGAARAAGHDAILGAADALRRGAVVAVKGLGGFQLLVDAGNDDAVRRLRVRKRRHVKPFAVMVTSIEAAADLAWIDAVERDLLCSAAAPIVLLAPGDAGWRLSAAVAPGMPCVGLMLPTTPLHHLLLREVPCPVVATSGNRSGEPIVIDEGSAVAQLGGIADCFLVHDRPIRNRVDDSVVRVIAGQPTVLRNARGYAPAVMAYSIGRDRVLALGGQQKSAVALSAGSTIVLGPYIGDLDDAGTQAAFRAAVDTVPALSGVGPTLVAHDCHPGYHSTSVAEALGRPSIQVPHHLAHVLACMADNDLTGPVLGVAWDGTGFGDDGTVWGGEFLAVTDRTWRRCASLWPFRLPGNEAAVREPGRSALGVLHVVDTDFRDAAGLAPVRAFDAGRRDILHRMLRQGINTPVTSSAGRLFDAVASLLDLCHVNDFEGHAAMLLEAAARTAAGGTDLPAADLVETKECLRVDWRPVIRGIIARHRDGAAVGDLAYGFHAVLAAAIADVADRAAIRSVVLTGGCFQNELLTRLTVQRLRDRGFDVFRHRRVPPNDGGLAVGQLVFAAQPRLQEQA